MAKLQRAGIMRDFRSGRYRALVVNDVAARGLDLPAVDLVFNLELPSSAAHYAHRAGRTGRMGAQGAHHSWKGSLYRAWNPRVMGLVNSVSRRFAP